MFPSQHRSYRKTTEGLKGFKLDWKTLPQFLLEDADKKLMKFLNLLENKVNDMLWKVIHLLWRLIPTPVMNFCSFLKRKIKHSLTWVKISPWILHKKVAQLKKSFSLIIAEIDFKTALGSVESKVKKNIASKNYLLSLKKYFIIFCHLLKRPFREFSPEQSATLIILSVSSVCAGVLIYFQTSRIYQEETKHLRIPASVEVIEFERPEYYKRELKSIQISGVRIPVYYPEVNELQTVTIDFNINLNNRIGRVFIERREFPLRDHLIHHLEPVLAQYSLDEEGKFIIKEKIAQEVQSFLDFHQIESEVEDVTLTYILAN